MEKDRKEMLTQMVTFMYNGEVAQELEMKVLRKKRFSTVKLARVSDMNSSFHPSALGAHPLICLRSDYNNVICDYKWYNCS